MRFFLIFEKGYVNEPIEIASTNHIRKVHHNHNSNVHFIVRTTEDEKAKWK